MLVRHPTPPIYVGPGGTREQQLREINAPWKGAAWTPVSFSPTGLVIADVRSRRHVLGRGCCSKTHEMDDLPGHDYCGIEQVRPHRFDTVDSTTGLVSNEKSQDSSRDLTRLTDLTPNRRGCMCRAFASARAPAVLATYPSIAVKSVKSVNSPPLSRGFEFATIVKFGVNLTPTAVDGVSA